MEVYVESVLQCSPEAAWTEVQKSSLLLEVARPIVTIQASGSPRLPERWEHHGVETVRSFLFGIVPLGTRVIYFERVDEDAREIQSRESDPLVRHWDHLVAVRETSDGRTRYSDRVQIEAGLLTPAVWLFAQCFYRHRQRRWQRVARRLQVAASAAALPRSAV
jgi:hypothetical protein